MKMAISSSSVFPPCCDHHAPSRDERMTKLITCSAPPRVWWAWQLITVQMNVRTMAASNEHSRVTFNNLKNVQRKFMDASVSELIYPQLDSSQCAKSA